MLPFRVCVCVCVCIHGDKHAYLHVYAVHISFTWCWHITLQYVHYLPDVGMSVSCVETNSARSRGARKTFRQMMFSSRPCMLRTMVRRRTGCGSTDGQENLSIQIHEANVRPDWGGNTRSPGLKKEETSSDLTYTWYDNDRNYFTKT